MKVIENNKEWDELIDNLQGLDYDCSNDDYVTQDFWDLEHDKVVACIKYFNNGDMVRYITEN